MKYFIVSFYRAFSATIGDMLDCLKRLKAVGVNGLRVFGAMTWSAGANLQPDKGNLYWGEARRFLSFVKSVGGFTIQLVLEDNCSLDQPSQLNRHWFVQKLGGDLAKFWNPYAWPEPIKQERIAYMKSWIGLFLEYQIPFFLEIINEPPAGILKFIKWHFEELKKLGITSSQLILSDDEKLIQHHSYFGDATENYSDIVSPHGIYRPGQIFTTYPPIVTQRNLKILYSADGLEDQPNEAILAALGTMIKADPRAIGYESKLNVGAGAGQYLNLDVINYDKLKAFGEALGTIPLPPPLMVTVKVCMFTNRVANPYCPVTAEVEFPISIAPTIVCDVHKAPKKSWWQRFLEWLDNF